MQVSFLAVCAHWFYTSAMADIQMLSVQPLAPRPEIFIRTLANLLKSGHRRIRLHFMPVFPFEERRDHLDYDEKVFEELGNFSAKIRMVLRADLPYRMPGKEDWLLPLDEQSDEGMRFLSRRIINAMEEIHSICGSRFAGIDICTAEPENMRSELLTCMAAELGKGADDIEIHGVPDISPSRWGLLPVALWEEQLFRGFEGGVKGSLDGSCATGFYLPWKKLMHFGPATAEQCPPPHFVIRLRLLTAFGQAPREICGPLAMMRRWFPLKNRRRFFTNSADLQKRYYIPELSLRGMAVLCSALPYSTIIPKRMDMRTIGETISTSFSDGVAIN